MNAAPALPAAAAAGPLRAADGRIILALALLLGVLVWHGGALAALAYAAGCAAAIRGAGVALPAALRRTGRQALLALPWAAAKALAALWGGSAAGAALAEGGLLGLRLAALLLLGAALTALLTPRALGLAAAGLLTPVLGRRAWSAALALALMIHFVPRALARFEGARAALRLRRLRVPRRRAALLVLEAGARNLAVGTWDQTLAIAARRLDRPEAWAVPPLPSRRQLAAGAAVATLAIALAVI